MLHEYAVDPEDLGRLGPMWVLMEQVSVAHGRVIADFPKSWFRLVYEAMDRANCPDVERLAIEKRMIRLRSALARLGGQREFSGSSWYEAAIRAHAMSKFRAIISERGDETQCVALKPTHATTDHPLWHVSTGKVIPRTASAIAESVAPLGRISKHFLFVDPYLCGDDNRMRVVLAILKASAADQRPLERVELHVWRNAGNLPTFGSQIKRGLAELKRPISIQVFKWDQLPAGDNMHARYFLTERGGIRCDYGFAVGQPGQTTDVAILGDSIYAERWKNYQPHTSPFRLAEPVFTVE